jgi:hypothetical protein
MGAELKKHTGHPTQYEQNKKKTGGGFIFNLVHPPSPRPSPIIKGEGEKKVPLSCLSDFFLFPSPFMMGEGGKRSERVRVV